MLMKLGIREFVNGVYGVTFKQENGIYGDVYQRKRNENKQ